MARSASIRFTGKFATLAELMFISKPMERIADHATNIAQKVVTLNSGEDVRHPKELKEAKRSAPP